MNVRVTHRLCFDLVQGRYIAPANSADCLQVRSGDCAPRELIIKALKFGPAESD